MWLWFISFFEEADEEFSWTEDELVDLYNNTSVIIAADGIYRLLLSTDPYLGK